MTFTHTDQTVTVELPRKVTSTVHKIARTIDLKVVGDKRDGDLAGWLSTMVEQGVSIVVARASASVEGRDAKIEAEAKKHAALADGKLDLRSSISDFVDAMRECAASDYGVKATDYKSEDAIVVLIESRTLGTFVTANKVKPSDHAKIEKIKASDRYKEAVAEKVADLRARAQAILDARAAVPAFDPDDFKLDLG